MPLRAFLPCASRIVLGHLSHAAVEGVFLVGHHCVGVSLDSDSLSDLVLIVHEVLRLGVVGALLVLGVVGALVLHLVRDTCWRRLWHAPISSQLHAGRESAQLTLELGALTGQLLQLIWLFLREQLLLLGVLGQVDGSDRLGGLGDVDGSGRRV